jgi:hypothetical protein
VWAQGQVVVHHNLPAHPDFAFSYSQRPGFRIRIWSGSIRPVDPDPDSERQKWPTKVEKFRNVMFESAGCSLLRDEGFFCNLDVLYEGLGIGKLKFFIPKNWSFYQQSIFFNFWYKKKTWIRIRRSKQSKMLDPDPYLSNEYGSETLPETPQKSKQVIAMRCIHADDTKMWIWKGIFDSTIILLKKNMYRYHDIV